MAPVTLTVDRRRRAWLAGRQLFSGDLFALIDHLEALRDDGQVHTLVTPNVDQVLLVQSDDRLRDAFDSADFLIADGAPLVMLGKLLGAHDLHRLTGADLLPAVAARAPQLGWRIAVVGGAPGVADRAAARLRAEHGADVVAVPFPRISAVEDPACELVVAALEEIGPDLVFVCLGSPKQDVWSAYWRDKLPAAVYVGAGAAVDFAAGLRRRAPRPIQLVGAEWLFRLAQEPRRLSRRYLVRGPGFVSIVARSVWTRLRERR